VKSGGYRITGSLRMENQRAPTMREESRTLARKKKKQEGLLVKAIKKVNYRSARIRGTSLVVVDAREG